jgi:hypothetical protein
MKKPQREKKKPNPLLKKGEYNLIQQLSICVVVCTLAFLSFLPYILKIELYDEDPDTPYSGAADDVLIDIINAVMVACMSMMLLEALLDSNTLYLPIKIAFPRFLMVLGVLFITLALYGQQVDGTDRLNFLICSHYAKLYFICAGLSLRLLREAAAERGSYRWILYIFGIILYMTEMQLRHWGAYFSKSDTFIIVQNCVTGATLLVAVFIVIKVVQCFQSHDHARQSKGQHYYDLMSHGIVCICSFGVNFINVVYGFQSWKNTTAKEITAYNIVGLFAIVLFFFTSSHMAQRHFVMAKVCTLYVLCQGILFLFNVCLNSSLYYTAGPIAQ